MKKNKWIGSTESGEDVAAMAASSTVATTMLRLALRPAINEPMSKRLIKCRVQLKNGQRFDLQRGGS